VAVNQSLHPPAGAPFVPDRLQAPQPPRQVSLSFANDDNAAQGWKKGPR
jgi:hypothetical protein